VHDRFDDLRKAFADLISNQRLAAARAAPRIPVVQRLMQTQSLSPDQLSNSELVAAVKRLLRSEHATTAQLVAHLGELDERRLYLAEGYSSLFKYCTDALSMTEDETFFRIHAARTARQYPLVLEMLAAGSIHLTTVRLVSSHLTTANAPELLAAVAGK